MAEKNIKKLVFDLGNGFVKAKTENGFIIAPSQIALESAVGGSSILDIMSQNTDSLNTYESKLDDGAVYIWGENLREIVSAEDLIHTYTHEKRYTNKRYKLLCEFILAELAASYEEDNIEAIVVTGMPSSEIATDDNEKLKSFLMGTHVVKRNGVEKTIKVVEVRILEQPMGTLLNEYLVDGGKMHKNLQENTITLIDFGSGTTIVDTYRRMQRVDALSKTIYRGMNDIYKEIASKVAAKFNLKSIDPIQVEEGVRNGFVLKVSGRVQHSFEDIAKEVIADTLEKTISDLDRSITVRDQIDEFIVTGGGAKVVGDEFKRLYNQEALKIVEDSQTANVNGYDKFASLLLEKLN